MGNQTSITAEQSAIYRSRIRTRAQREAEGISNNRNGWPYGPKDRKMRAKFIALLKRVGKPSQAWQLLDDLELWPDNARPPKMTDPFPYSRWLKAADDGVMPDKKTLNAVNDRYDAYMGEALFRASTIAAETAIDQYQKVQEGTFNEKYGGVVQHAGQMAVMGYEKVMQSRRPVKESAKIQFSPSFVLNPPPAQLNEGVIEGEMRELG